MLFLDAGGVFALEELAEGVSTHEQAGGYLAPEPLIIPQSLGQAVRLVACQGIHRVEKDRLDARLLSVAPAMVEDRKHEALRLSGPRASGHQCVLWLVAILRE